MRRNKFYRQIIDRNQDAINRTMQDLMEETGENPSDAFLISIASAIAFAKVCKVRCSDAVRMMENLYSVVDVKTEDEGGNREHSEL